MECTADGLSERLLLRLACTFAGRIGGERQEDVFGIGNPKARWVLRHGDTAELRPQQPAGGIEAERRRARIGGGAAEYGRQFVDLTHVAGAVGGDRKEGAR